MVQPGGAPRGIVHLHPLATDSHQASLFHVHFSILYIYGDQEDLGAGVCGQDCALGVEGGGPVPGGITARGRGGGREYWTRLLRAERRI